MIWRPIKQIISKTSRRKQKLLLSITHKGAICKWMAIADCYPLFNLFNFCTCFPFFSSFFFFFFELSAEYQALRLLLNVFRF